MNDNAHHWFVTSVIPATECTLTQIKVESFLKDTQTTMWQIACFVWHSKQEITFINPGKESCVFRASSEDRSDGTRALLHSQGMRTSPKTNREEETISVHSVLAMVWVQGLNSTVGICRKFTLNIIKWIFMSPLNKYSSNRKLQMGT